MHRRRLRGLRGIAEFRHWMEVCSGQTDRRRMSHGEEHCKKHHRQMTTHCGHSNNNYFFWWTRSPNLIVIRTLLPRTPLQFLNLRSGLYVASPFVTDFCFLPGPIPSPQDTLLPHTRRKPIYLPTTSRMVANNMGGDVELPVTRRRETQTSAPFGDDIVIPPRVSHNNEWQIIHVQKKPETPLILQAIRVNGPFINHNTYMQTKQKFPWMTYCL